MVIPMRPRRLTSRLSRIYARNAAGSRVLAAIVAGSALLGGGAFISGCGSSETLDPVAKAANLSSQQQGVRFTLQMALSSPALPSGFTITGNGYANGSKAGRISLDLSQVPGLSAVAGGSGATVETVYTYPTVYMHMPFLADKLPEGKSWMKLDLSKVTEALGGSPLPQAFSLGQADPSQFLQYLKASSGEVTKVGTQQLYHTSTTQYQATLQLSHVLQDLPESERTAAKAMLQHVGSDGSIPVSVWIDTQGRVRRMQIALNVAGAAASGSATVTVGFTQYGPVPSITPPPDSEVTDLTSLLSTGSLSKQGG
jgi:hypothetical protein